MLWRDNEEEEEEGQETDDLSSFLSSLSLSSLRMTDWQARIESIVRETQGNLARIQSSSGSLRATSSTRRPAPPRQLEPVVVTAADDYYHPFERSAAMPSLPPAVANTSTSGLGPGSALLERLQRSEQAITELRAEVSFLKDEKRRQTDEIIELQGTYP